MVSHKHLRIILSNLTGLFAVTAVIMAVMAVLCVLLNEAYAAPGFLVAMALSGGLAIVLKLLFPRAEDLELRHAMLVAAIAYLAVPAVSVFPFLMVEQMTVIDAFFESISGWTCTGMTMIQFPEHSSRSIQLYRSTMEWIGGIGVILLMVTILIRPGTSTYLMYKSETRKDRIMPSIQSTLKMIWFLYFLLTVGGVLLLIIAGMPVWDSINHSMVAIGTGGFSIYSDSIAHYNSFPIEIVTMALMIIGALPFIFIFKVIKNPETVFRMDSEVKAFFFILLLGAALVTAENYLHFGNLLGTFRHSVYLFVSCLTTCGLQTSNLTGWSYTSLLIMSIAAIIGGCAGSTTGGLKVARAMFLYTEFRLWLKRTLLPRNAIVTIKIGNKRLEDDVVTKELSEAALILFLYLITILISVMVLSHLVDPKYDLCQIIFSICSAQGNVGIQNDLINPAMSSIGKVLLMINMWLGRLEIIPVLLLLRALLKGFKV
ncbi:putative K(+) uptake system, membrane component [Methanocella arvoryzae MRE50]|uniref:K(+) uptake system, membrane component n=1 Tax=Methanocella arvoryzae (strain DSM 22066 / NBRC 105507 / MRE50) TaxID=351160 RepID=Q0W0D6_METAR|nr:putative K(+) uptake system, membrane component [Methanocella arvoryzae MRE50]